MTTSTEDILVAAGAERTAEGVIYRPDSFPKGIQVTLEARLESIRYGRRRDLYFLGGDLMQEETVFTLRLLNGETIEVTALDVVSVEGTP